MSRRTAEASKAIREAWENEQRLVSEGKGTRDWTPEQQQSIIDVGKAYDDNGKAFIGHHMKSAECYPEYQGDPGNIQFLSYPEHLKAHDGNWRNPSNWYYNPVTGTKQNFDNEKYKPCDVVVLSAPLPSSLPTEPIVASAEETVTEKILKEKSENVAHTEEQTSSKKNEYSAPPYIPKVPYEPKKKKGFLDKAADFIGSAVEWAKDFVEEHPAISTLMMIGVAAASKAAVDSISSKHSSAYDNGDRYYSNDYSSHETLNTSDDSYDDFKDSDYGIYDDSSGVSTRDYPEERSSPTEHDVSGYTRQQNGKTVNVRSYKRGGK